MKLKFWASKFSKVAFSKYLMINAQMAQLVLHKTQAVLLLINIQFLVILNR
jgi:hypothetical protein